MFNRSADFSVIDSLKLSELLSSLVITVATISVMILVPTTNHRYVICISCITKLKTFIFCIRLLYDSLPEGGAGALCGVDVYAEDCATMLKPVNRCRV